MNTFETFKSEVGYMPHRHMSHEIPEHLRKYVVEQDYQHYTAEDQAVWRYVMRQLIDFLSIHAHPSYLEGLQKTGIGIEKIPRIEEIDKKLKEFGWGAVPVSGFIPPAAFMEFQSRSFLPIASDMRTLEHLLYTPAPDIVHEAAGHAPILIDPGFANYLKEYAKVAANAIISKVDLEQYRLIRKLSDLKELPGDHKQEIQKAEAELNKLSADIKNISEAGYLSRMNWWTAEYGLIGPIDNPKIFGAGLLSSLGESRHCLSNAVKKIPLSIDCINYTYDITEPQPQLFVAKNFAELSKVLHELADTMAFKTGGPKALEKARLAESVNSVELESGLQISGVLSQYKLNDRGEPIFLKFSGPSQLSYLNKELPGHHKEYHANGFSSPLGLLKGQNVCLSQFNTQKLKEIGISIGQKVALNFESGIELKGRVKGTTSKNDTLLIITFEDCSLTFNDETLFDSSWGDYDLALGSFIPSVFGGPADRLAFGDSDKGFTATRVPLRVFSSRETQQHEFFRKIRNLRQSSDSLKMNSLILSKLISEYFLEFQDNWLIGVELLECAHLFKCEDSLIQELVKKLTNLNFSNEVKQCVLDGVRLAAIP